MTCEHAEVSKIEKVAEDMEGHRRYEIWLVQCKKCDKKFNQKYQAS